MGRRKKPLVADYQEPGLFRYWDGEKETERDLPYLFERLRDVAAELAFAFRTESTECWTRQRLTDMIRSVFGLKRTFLAWDRQQPLPKEGLNDEEAWTVMERFFGLHGKELIDIFKEVEKQGTERRQGEA